MFTVFECRKCGMHLFVEEDKGFPKKLEKIAGHICDHCGEQAEGLWKLLGRAKEFEGEIAVEWEEYSDDE